MIQGPMFKVRCDPRKHGEESEDVRWGREENQPRMCNRKGAAVGNEVSVLLGTLRGNGIMSPHDLT